MVGSIPPKAIFIIFSLTNNLMCGKIYYQEVEEMDYKQFVKEREGTFRHQYIYDKEDKKIGVIVYKDGYFGWSFCSNKDTFSKNKGKAIALLRAESKKSSLLKIPFKYFRLLDQVEKKVNVLKDHARAI